MRKFSLFMEKVNRHFWMYVYLYTGLEFKCKGFSLYKYGRLKSDLKRLKEQAKESQLEFPITRLWACYSDKESDAGELSYQYFYQDLYVAQRIYINNPVSHVDIGSRIDGFVAHVASFREIKVYDIRPLSYKIPNVTFIQLDLMKSEQIEPNQTDSISCLHALEHFGLGRYGDEIDFEGYLTGFNNITKLLSPKGRFYFSVPFGRQRIEFHAHRVFSLSYLLELVDECYTLERFSYVDDENVFYENIYLTDSLIESNCGCNYGCAIFELIKK